jgi:hypothetical protein
VSAFGIGSMIIICNSKGALFWEKVSEEKLPYYIMIVGGCSEEGGRGCGT